tara:strand:- start:7121 stop:7435 length:315 start_codon:yes stop_codon:yes gene_type:complete
MLGVGSAAQAMINSLKNNSRVKNRTRYFDKKRLNSKSSNSKRNKLLDKKASPELLVEIKSEMIEENRKAKIKNRIIILLSLLITILIFVFIQIKYMDSFRKFLS